jgi:hypothetical protein
MGIKKNQSVNLIKLKMLSKELETTSVTVFEVNG